jgi:putative hydrolase of HD superfamily
MSIITMLAPRSISARINIPHCTKMALIHDMAELLVGDITPVDGVPKPEKSRREEETMEYLTKGLLGQVDGGLAGEDIMKVWKEYEDSETPEAQFVHDIDKIELLLQMVEYERTYKGEVDLSEFVYVSTKLELPEMKQWAEEILKERKAFWDSTGKEEPKISTADRPEHLDERLARSDAYYAK